MIPLFRPRTYESSLIPQILARQAIKKKKKRCRALNNNTISQTNHFHGHQSDIHQNSSCCLDHCKRLWFTAPSTPPDSLYSKLKSVCQWSTISSYPFIIFSSIWWSWLLYLKGNNLFICFPIPHSSRFPPISLKAFFWSSFPGFCF